MHTSAHSKLCSQTYRLIISSSQGNWHKLILQNLFWVSKLQWPLVTKAADLKKIENVWNDINILRLIEDFSDCGWMYFGACHADISHEGPGMAFIGTSNKSHCSTHTYLYKAESFCSCRHKFPSFNPSADVAPYYSYPSRRECNVIEITSAPRCVVVSYHFDNGITAASNIGGWCHIAFPPAIKAQEGELRNIIVLL